MTLDRHFVTVILVDEKGVPISAANPLDVGGSGGVSSVDNAAFTPGASSGTPAFFEVDDTGTSQATEGSAGIARMSIDRILMVGGNVAHDGVDSGNPVKIGGRGDSGNQTAVANGDRVDAWFNRVGALMIGAAQYGGGAGADSISSLSGLMRRDETAAANPTPLYVGAGFFNGTQWDRMRGDITNGLDVDVTRIAGVVSTNNSTTSVLSGGAVFTGTSDSVVNYASIMVSVFASHASAADGLSLQQSSNGTNWDITDTYTIPATTGKVFTINPSSSFFRIVYTNGATLQTSFRLQVVYKYIAATESSQRATDGYTNETDLQQQQAFLMGYNGTTWDRVRTTGTGVLSVSSAETSSVPGVGATNLGKAEDAAHTTGDTGVMALGVRAAAPTDRSVGPTDGDYEPFATNEVGAVWASLTPSANGGCDTFMASGSDGSSILVATKQTVKASAGNLYGYYIYNPEAAVTFLHFYNTDTVTVGTTNPKVSYAIPAGAAANIGLPYPVKFDTAISTAATTTAGGNTAPSTGLSLVAYYK